MTNAQFIQGECGSEPIKLQKNNSNHLTTLAGNLFQIAKTKHSDMAVNILYVALSKFFYLTCPPFFNVHWKKPCTLYNSVHFICVVYGLMKSCLSDVEKFGQTLLDYFAMLLCVMVNIMVELKELCFGDLIYADYAYGNRQYISQRFKTWAMHFPI